MKAVVVAAIATLVLLGAGCGNDDDVGAAGGELRVATASDLRPAFTELGRAFEQATGIRPVFSFGSSGQLAQQIAHGAPFELFASASADYVDHVIAAGRGQRATKATYAFGRLVVWSPRRAYTLKDLDDRSVGKVAIANPEHAPYGRAARQALERDGRWPAVRSKLVLGENVSDTRRLAQSGNADAAIIALSLAIASPGKWTPVPARLHAPLEQALVVTGTGTGAQRAARFAAFLAGDHGRSVMRRFGLLLPGERLGEAARGG